MKIDEASLYRVNWLIREIIIKIFRENVKKNRKNRLKMGGMTQFAGQEKVGGA